MFPIHLLALIAIASTAGGLFLPTLILFLISLCVASAWILLLKFKKTSKQSGLYLIWTLFFLWWSWLDSHPINPLPLTKPREFVQVEVFVCNEPVQLQRGKEESEEVLIACQLEKWREVTGWEERHGRVLLQVRKNFEQYAYGDRLRVEGMLEKYRGMGFGLWKSRYRLQTTGAYVQKLKKTKDTIFFRAIFSSRRFFAGVLNRGLEDFSAEAAVQRALLLGYRNDLPEDLNELFAHTGTLHIFAISGLHVGIVALIFIFLLQACGIDMQRWIFFLAPALLFFVLVTGAKASALRAFIMAVLYWSAPLFRRKPNASTALALAVIIILLLAPVQLVDVGFLYSFFIVLGLILLYPRWARPLKNLIKPDPWGLPANTSEKKSIGKFLFPPLQLVILSIIAWLCSFPLTAYFFNHFTPSALLGNLLVIPSAFFIVVTGFLSMVFGSFISIFAEIFNHANRAFIFMLVFLIKELENLPGAHQYVAAPPVFFVVCYYLLLWGVLLWAKKWRLMVYGFILLGISWGVYSLKAFQRGYVDFLNVGNGQASILVLPGKQTTLVDTGPRFFSFKLFRALRISGIDKIQTIYLTHGDTAHHGAALKLIEHYPIDEICLPRTPTPSRSFKEIVSAARNKNITVHYLSRDDPKNYDREIFYPGKERLSRKNDDHSLVLRCAFGNKSVLFCGGAGESVERALLKQPVEPSATILVAGNHRSEKGCIPAWLDLVEPESVVLSQASWFKKIILRNKWEKRIEQVGAQALFLEEQGDLRYNINNGKWENLKL